jgi:hypothetical protein
MRFFVAITVLALTLGVLEGCGPPRKLTAAMSGRVTFKGQPLMRGRIIFMHKSGQSASGEIGADGRYKLNAPVGFCYVAVSCHEAPPANITPEKLVPGVFNTKSLIPERYEDYTKSGLSFNVQEGISNSADWSLK